MINLDNINNRLNNQKFSKRNVNWFNRSRRANADIFTGSIDTRSWDETTAAALKNQPIFNMTMSEEEAESQLSARRSRSMSSIQRTIQKKEKQIEKKNSSKKKGRARFLKTSYWHLFQWTSARAKSRLRDLKPSWSNFTILKRIQQKRKRFLTRILSWSTLCWRNWQTIT